MAYKVQIHFDYRHQHTSWEEKAITDICNELEKILCVHSPVDGIYIDSINGKPVLRIQVWPDRIDVWNAVNGRIIGVIMGTSKDEMNMLEEWNFRVAEGLTMCNECSKWVEEYRSYSFAGAVCKYCFDPDVHNQPDSR